MTEDRTAPLRVACPQCGATAGSPCTTTRKAYPGSGIPEKVVICRPHRERFELHRKS